MKAGYILLLWVSLGLAGCHRDTATPAPNPNAVATLADLPDTYSPLPPGSPKGRIKSELSTPGFGTEYVFTNQGNLLERRGVKNGAPTGATRYHYDATGQLRFVQDFGNNCGFSSSLNCTGPISWQGYTEIINDAGGRMTESRTYLKQATQWELRSITTYNYDSENRPIKLSRFDAAHKLSTTQDFTYDAKGNIIRMSEQNFFTASPDLKDRTFIYTYEAGLNPNYKTLYYVSAFFSSPHLQQASDTQYILGANGYPIRATYSGTAFTFSYY